MRKMAAGLLAQAALSAALSSPLSGCWSRCDAVTRLASPTLFRTPSVRLAVAAEGTPPPAPLTLSKVAELVEATFVRACMDAARGDVTTLKLFIASAVGGYRLGVPLPALGSAVAACEAEHSTAGRPLLPEEAELRTLWLSLVYLTLEAEGEAAPPGGDGGDGGDGRDGRDGGEEPLAAASVDASARDEYSPLVEEVRRKVGGGAALGDLSVDDLVGADPQRTPLRAAVRSQTASHVRVVCFSDARRAGRRAGGGRDDGAALHPGDGAQARLRAAGVVIRSPSTSHRQ